MHKLKPIEPNIVLFDSDVMDGVIVGASTAARQRRYRSKDVLMADKDLTLSTKCVYVMVMDMCQDKGYCWATDSKLAKLCGCSRSAVSKAIHRLKKAKYVMSELERVGYKWNRRMYVYDRGLG